MLAVSSLFSLSSFDLAQPVEKMAQRLSSSPPIWLTHEFIPLQTVEHIVSKVPKDEAAYVPCIGQVHDFDSKKCTMLPAKGDAIIEGVLSKVASTWGIDTSRLVEEGLPIIRYLPGAPPVGKHGDEDRYGSVPNATLVMYLTKGAAAGTGGQTIFPEADVAVTPRQGSVLSFQNVDDTGAPHPHGKHLVGAVPKDSQGDRLVVQIPIAHPGSGAKPYAYPQHVSGGKKPGQHESMHGSDAQKAAAAAALAAGMAIAVQYMAAKAGKFELEMEAELTAQAKETGKFSDEDFVKKEQVD